MERASGGGGAELLKWHLVNPGANAFWRLPQGLESSQCFGNGRRENQSGFPKVKHHKSGKKQVLCLKYQALGVCPKGGNCPFAHIAPQDMDPQDVQIASDRFKEVYATVG